MDFSWLWGGSTSGQGTDDARHFAWMASSHAFEFARAAERRGLRDLSLVFEMAALEATEIEALDSARGGQGRIELAPPKPPDLSRWRVTRLVGRAARDVGIVHAVDASHAIRIAIRKYEITDPEKQKRLAARRVA